MKVLKFGGSSITPEIVLNVKKIVESKKEPVVVVVSALTGITDKLYKVTELAAAGDSAYTEVLNEICSLHTNMVDALHLDTTTARTSVNKLLDELKNILQGVFLIKDISDRIADTIVGYGEQLSSIIVSRLIDGATHVDSRTFIKTHTQFGRHVVDFELTNELISKQFENMPSVVVCGGFIASISAR